MIHHNGKEIVSIHHLGRAIAAVYHAGKLVWQAVRSCFGSGVWVPTKPWLDHEKWKNHK